MRKPPITGVESTFRSQVYELWMKHTISTRVPSLDDMEVGELRILDAQTANGQDYRVYIKPNQDLIFALSGDSTVAVISAAFDTGFTTGFQI
jgi:hypothetical protein